jgi:ABC-type nitrate/sulfonate/bicarbonate transport system substrate-binding protein
MKRHHIVLPRREFLKMGGAGVLGTFIAAATLNRAGAQTPDMENIKANLQTLRMGEFNPNYATQWSYRLASALGYFKEVGIENLDVTLSEEYMAGLIGGSLDVTHGDTSVFFGSGNASGLPVTMTSLYRDKEWWIMGVREGIDSFDDLKGKKITGGGLEGRNTWIMKQVLMENGLDPDNDIEFVPMSGGSDARLQAVLAGTVDAASMFPRHQAGLEAAGGKFISANLHEVPQEGFASMGTWLAENEDTAYAWALADIKARQFMFDPTNKDECYKIMRDLGFDIPPEFEAQYQLELDQISPDCGFAGADVMDNFVASLAVTGDLPEGLDWRQYMDMKYVWAAQEAIGLPKRPASL